MFENDCWYASFIDGGILENISTMKLIKSYMQRLGF